MKTKEEIINEIASAYNSNTRAIDHEGCVYHTKDGRQCAVGRSLTDEAHKGIDEHKINGGRANYLACYLNPNYCSNPTDDINFLLKEEYRGHDVKFWRSMQSFHDQPTNWNEDGLSQEGKEALKYLLNCWKDQ